MGLWPRFVGDKPSAQRLFFCPQVHHHILHWHLFLGYSSGSSILSLFIALSHSSQALFDLLDVLLFPSHLHLFLPIGLLFKARALLLPRKAQCLDYRRDPMCLFLLNKGNLLAALGGQAFASAVCASLSVVYSRSRSPLTGSKLPPKNAFLDFMPLTCTNLSFFGGGVGNW